MPVLLRILEALGGQGASETLGTANMHAISSSLPVESFASMFESSAAAGAMKEGQVIAATVLRIDNDSIVVDIGLKTEGRIPIEEFSLEDKQPAPGDIVDVYLDRIENALGEAVLSREKARREERWVKLERSFAKGEPVKGAISGRVKGGFTVDLGGVNAFLPGSQVDIRPVRDVGPLMGEVQPFAVLKLDRVRGNIVVSRRAILEESRAEQRAEIVSDMKEGDVRKGVVKNITDYGAFVDLGGIDGLLHVTDMSYKRINHPSQVVEVGQEVEVQIIKINPETQRISLGMKQLGSDPWDNISARYPSGARLKGIVTNITDYGAFVELEDGVEGLIHVSEMSWTKKNVHPGKLLSTTQEVEVEVLDVDSDKRRISLGLKQTMDNPWNAFIKEHPVGSEIEGEVRGITEFGLFVGLGPDLDGMVHINDISWDKPGDQAIEAFTKGDRVKAKVLDVDVDKERISLGIKQLSGDPIEAAGSGESGGIKRGSTVTCTVTEVSTGGLEVEFGTPPVKTFIRRSDLSRDRADQRPERFAVGDKVDAKVVTFDKASRRVSLSIKALEIAEEAEALAQYGSADAGASLGAILGAALATSGSRPFAARSNTTVSKSAENASIGGKGVAKVSLAVPKVLGAAPTDISSGFKQAVEQMDRGGNSAVILNDLHRSWMQSFEHTEPSKQLMERMYFAFLALSELENHADFYNRAQDHALKAHLFGLRLQDEELAAAAEDILGRIGS